MAKIRSINVIDKFKIDKMMRNLDIAKNVYDHQDLPNYFISLAHKLLPQKIKFLQEAYVCKYNKQIKGMVALKPAFGNSSKWKITKLMITDNSLDFGKQLIEFVVTKYGAANVNTFTVSVEDSDESILELFSKGCGFRFCSKKQLWEVGKISRDNILPSNIIFRPFKNSDSLEVASVFNNLIFPHFRYSLAKSKQEFYDTLFPGLSNQTTFKFVVEDTHTKKIISFFSIKTIDNVNFILNATLSLGYDEYFENILEFSVKQIIKRQRNFKLFVVHKQFNQNNLAIEKYMKDNDFKLAESRCILVKDYYKTVSEDNRSKSSVMILNNVNNPAF